jgi:hypothetical protein
VKNVNNRQLSTLKQAFLTLSCQSGVKHAFAAAAVAIAFAALPAAAQPGWAHKGPDFNINGAITLQTRGGDSVTATQNPVGAVAKANQSAATQPPTVIIQATASSTPILMMTAVTYTGNLGGVAGADAKCVAEFGASWKFAEIGKLQVGVAPTGEVLAWIHDAASNSCQGWTSSSGTYTNRMFKGGNSSSWASTTSSCNVTARLACINF